MQINMDSPLWDIFRHFQQSYLPIQLGDKVITSYQALTFAGDVLSVLIDQEVANPIEVLKQMCTEKAIKDVPKLFTEFTTFHKVSPVEPLYKTVQFGSIPVFGMDYISGQLKCHDAALICSKLEMLLMTVTQIFEHCRCAEITTTMPYCLNKDADFAKKCGFDFIVISQDESNKMDDVIDVKWV